MIHADNLRDAVYVSYSMKKRKNASNERVTSIPKDYDTNKREFKLPSLAFWLAERPFRLKNRSKTREFTTEVASSALRLWILILETSVSSLKVSLINYLALVRLIPRPRTF